MSTVDAWRGVAAEDVDDMPGSLAGVLRRRSRRLELRTTPEERDLIDRAVAASGGDLTEFVVFNAVDAARWQVKPGGHVPQQLGCEIPKGVLRRVQGAVAR